MSFGDGTDDLALRNAWKAFCGKLEAAGELAFKDNNPPGDLHRADAFRFLTQNLGQAFDLALETRNTRYPVIHQFCTPFRKLGGDNADYTYQQAWIDGNSVYRISGNLGTARFFNIAVQGERPADKPGWRGLHDPFGDKPEANIFRHQLEMGWDGSFELFIGGEQRGENWLPTTPNSRKLFIRQGFDDWAERPAQMRIERIDMREPRPMPDPHEMIESMAWAGTFLHQMMIDWPDWSYEFVDTTDPNSLNRFPGQQGEKEDLVYNAESDKIRGRAINNMCWKLSPEDALIIEFDRNEHFWMLTNMGPFMTSMDFLYRPVSYTPARTKVDGDGKIRLVMAHRDPAYHNWIDTQGFEQGNLTARNNMTSEGTEFRTKVVKFSELGDHMPADSAVVTAEERAELMLLRYHSIQRRYLL